jgi:hypothetical protein
MSILSWNCYGMGQPRTVQELVQLVHTTAVKIVFISETRQHRDRVNNIKGRLGMNNCFVVDGVGRGGGLALYWNDEIKIQVLSYGLHHVDTLVWDGVHHTAWHATFVYGEPRTHERDKMWELMRQIKPCQYASWLMLGDFNEVMWSFEHFLSRRRLPKQMMDFREVLSYCDLHDLGFSGLPWT